MFQRKTFNLVNEEETKKRENLYEPKRCRWMKFIVIPAMIGFILLLILTNVDFSHKTKTTTRTASRKTDVEKTTLLPIQSEQRALSYNLLSNNNKAYLNAARCAEKTAELCTTLCSNGNVNFMAGDLEETSYACIDDLNVIVDNCSFPSQQLMTVTFRGDFHLISLEITNSDLVEIIDGAFDIQSMTKLTMLHLNTTGIAKLTERSFKGLIALQKLIFTNVPRYTYSKFEGVKFLQPLAQTLQEVRLCQRSKAVVCDPLSWFAGNAKFSSLVRVNLTGNNFASTLSEATFMNLTAVRELILTDCSITELKVNTFVGIMETLEYLDLSYNALQTLDVSLLLKKKGLRLELHNNEWICSCENMELITALQDAQFTYVQEPLCMTPSQWKDKPLKAVTLKCGEEPTTTQEPTSSNTPSPAETPSTSSSTIITTVSTTSTSVTTTSSPVETPSTSSSTITTTISTTSTSDTTSTSLQTISTETTKPSLQTTPSLDPSTNSNTSSTVDPNDTSPSITSSDATKETEAITTTASVTVTTASSTKPTPPTPTPPKPPTPAPVKLTELACKNFPNIATSTNYTISIRDYDARFTVRVTSSTSVAVLVLNNMQHLSLNYFTANNRTITTEHSGFEVLSTSYTIIHVENLLSKQTYIFCLMPIGEPTMSPFNCHSYQIEVVTLGESKAWLLSNDQAWFIILVIFFLLLSICCGLISVYWLLRWRPAWLRGCTRIIKTDAATHEVYLLPKPQRKCSLDDSNYHKVRNSDRMHSNLNLDFDSYDYMQFYKDLQDANRNRKVHTLSSLLSPKEQAPTVPQNQTLAILPPNTKAPAVPEKQIPTILAPKAQAPAVPQNQSRTVSLQSTIPADDLIENCEANDENVYQSINYYEQLF